VPIPTTAAKGRVEDLLPRSAFIVAAVRTPIGKFLGGLSSLSAADLGAAALREVLRRAPAPAGAVDEVIFGNARQAGGGPNVARQIAVRAGIPVEVPAYTVNMACASGMKCVALAAQAIADGEANVVAAGGAETMSRVPYLLDRARVGYRMGNTEVVDAMYRDGFLCPLANQVMGETAENLVDQYGIAREEQDAFALESQRRAAAAIGGGRFDREIVAVEVPGAKGDAARVTADEHPRPDATADGLARLAPVFRKAGTVTAGNSSGIVDGAAALLLADEASAARLGLPRRARVVGWAQAGVEPRVMGIGVVPAVRRLLDKTGLRLEDFDLVEMNEAFAAQVLAVLREVPVDRARLNVNGGAIALGHPIGATGARILVTLLHEMERRGARRGLAALCVSGGQGMAVALERPSNGGSV
jgi:acetyl-CoA C-acetyltransferase